VSRGPPQSNRWDAPPLGWATLRDALGRAWPTLKLVWASAPGSTLSLGLLTAVSALAPVGAAVTGKAIVDAVVGRDPSSAGRWIVLDLLLVTAMMLSERGLSFVRQAIGARLSLDINGRILAKAVGLELRHFEDPEFYDRLTRARREASSRPLAVVTDLFRLAQGLVSLAGYVGLLVGYSGWMALVLAAASVPAAVAEMRFSGAAFRLRNWRSPDVRKLAYLEFVLSNDEHAKEVKLLDLGAPLLGRYRSMGERFYREDIALAARRAGWGAGLGLVSTAAFYGAYAAVGLSAARGAIGVGALTLYLVAFRQGQQAFQSCLSAIGGMFENNLYMANLFDFLAMEATPSAPVVPVVVEARPEAGIRFEGVGFRYPESEKWALRGVDLFIPKGRSLALVGHNGAGKTTFIKLLSRLYEPTEGRILVDGEDIRAMDPVRLRERLAVVFQDFNQYQFPLSENVGLGDVARLEDREGVVRAAAAGGADEVAVGLAQGLDTQLGRWFRGGVELSGGQWQKVALGRGFMREQADILVLDEPTAALDAEAEHRVFERVRELTKGRTTLLISHRFSTVRTADTIVVLEGGGIVEQGTHEALLGANGRYARMFRLQAEGYR
jgi:ATP-binding cassette subfamily B protein